ncbi:MAG TPA: fibronectin type III domain-containing protein, partial [Actinomycetaceae bacterium]|nr:fibronectin type III domain-containing protein [Actinomycetaceae bacterium]
VPTDPGPVPTSDGPQQAPVGDPRFAPESLVLVDRGTSAELSWSPPAADVDYYLVTVVTDDGATVEVVRMVSAPATEYTVQGLDPDDPFECFAVVGYGQEDGQIVTGSSDLECR